LALLVLAQIYLARRSRRRFNPGLVSASLLVVALLGWLVVAGLLSARGATDAREHGGLPLGTAVTARILAQQARADEILGLLKRGSDTQSDKNFEERTAQLRPLLQQVDGADDALAGWVQAHDDIRHLLAAGDYPGAVAVARDDGPWYSTPEFTRLDTALRDEITRLRTTQRDGITRAYTALNGLPFGAAAIGILAALMVAGGVGPRLSEYH